MDIKTKDIAGHISATYRSLRTWIVITAVAIPWVL